MADKIIPEKIFESMGMTLEIEGRNFTLHFKGIIQPLRYKNKLYLHGIPTELGYDSLKKYLLICAHHIQLEDVDGKDTRLLLESDSFRVDHCEKVYFKGAPYYYWAIIHKEEKI